jgi:hypothetical protein
MRIDRLDTRMRLVSPARAQAKRFKRATDAACSSAHHSLQ